MGTRRRFMGVVTLATLIMAGSLTTVGVQPAAAEPAIDCQDVFFVWARGTGQGENEREYSTLRDKISDRISDDLRFGARELGSEGGYGGYRYDARPRDTFWWWTKFIAADYEWMDGPGDGEYLGSVAQGVGEARAYINARTTACPHETLVLGGYSQGAHVMGEALFGMTDRSQIAFVSLFGDPKLLTNGKGLYPPACKGDVRPWRRGNIRCYHDGGALEPRNPYVPSDIENRVGSWCDKQDGICTGNITRVGDDAHKQYPDHEMEEAAKEIAEHLKDARPHQADAFDTTILPVSIGTTGLDIAIALDTTGSMSGAIASAKNSAETIASVVTALPNGRVSLIAYRDHGDDYVSKLVVPFTRDVSAFRDGLATLSADGGGDYPEAVLSALMTAFNDQAWTDGATKAAIVLADAPGKDPEPVTGYTMAAVLQRAFELDPVIIYPVVSTHDGFFEALAAGSGGEVIDWGEDVGERIVEVINTVSQRPTALFDVTPVIAQPGQEVTLRGASSYDIDGEIVEYRWDVNGDGTIDATTPEPALDWTYDSPFDGLASLTVVDNDGETGTVTTEVVISTTAFEDLLPNMPTAVAASKTSPTSAKVVVDPDDPALGHVLLANGEPIGYAAPGDTEFSISGIPAGEVITFGVAAENEFGQSPVRAAAPLAFTTGPGGPVPVVDTDRDGHPDSSDNCPAVPNTDQADTNNDGVGDACQPGTDDLESLACPPELIPSAGFTDVNPTNMGIAVDCLVWWNITNGLGDGTFGSSAPVTRGQLASFLTRTAANVLNLPTTAHDAFTDDEGNVHEHAINVLASLGIMRGLADGTSGHDTPVTRAQAATLLVRTLEWMTGETLPAGPDRFDDDDGNVHEANINSLVETSLILGTTVNRFAPDDSLTRFQMALIITRSLGYLIQADHLTPRP